MTVNPYLPFAAFLVALFGITVIYYILAFRYHFISREYNGLVGLIFHQVYDLLDTIVWHSELLKSNEFGKLSAEKLEQLKKIDVGIANVLQIHREFFEGPAMKEHLFSETEDEAEKRIIAMDNALREIKVPLVFHELLDLLTGIKWETEILAVPDSHARHGVVQVKMLARIDREVENAIALLDRFLRISGKHTQLPEKSARRVLTSRASEYMSPEQKKMLELKA